MSNKNFIHIILNGRGRFVVMDIEDYEREKAEKKLLEKLQEAEEAVKDGTGWLSLEELEQCILSSGEHSFRQRQISLEKQEIHLEEEYRK